MESDYGVGSNTEVVTLISTLSTIAGLAFHLARKQFDSKTQFFFLEGKPKLTVVYSYIRQTPKTLPFLILVSV